MNNASTRAPLRYAEMGAAIRCLFSTQLIAGAAQPMGRGGSVVWAFGNASAAGAAVTSRNLSVAVLEELLRLERLQQLAERFYKKADLRETWLGNMLGKLAETEFGSNLAEVTASKRREDAIETEVKASADRLRSIMALKDELVAENYWEVAAVQNKYFHVEQNWSQLGVRLEERRSLLALELQFHGVIAELDEVVA